MVGALACSVVLAGCTSTVRGTATFAGDGSTGEIPSSSPPDAAHLQSTLAVLEDLPAGWSDTYGDDYDDWTLPTLAECPGGTDTISRREVVRGGDVFEAEYGDQVSSVVASFRSQDDVDSDTALLTDPEAAGCLSPEFDEGLESLPSGVADFGAVTFTITPGSSGGPSNVVATASGHYTVTPTTGETFPAYFDYVFLTGRMTEAQIFLRSTVVPFPADTRALVVGAVPQRLAAL